MKALLLIPLILIFSPVQETNESWITQEEVDAIFKKAAPFIEKHTGLKFTKNPVIRIVSPDVIVSVFKNELRIQPVVTDGLKSMTEADVDRVVSEMSSSYATAIFGKYGFLTKEIYLVPSNISAELEQFEIPEEKRDVYMLYVLVHECIHYMADLHFNSSGYLRKIDSTEVGMSFNALSEGHADYVTEKVLRDLEVQEGDIQLIMKRAKAETATGITFSNFYNDGRKFVESIVKSEGNRVLRRAYRRPPDKTEYIYYPEKYLDYLKRGVSSKVIDFKEIFRPVVRGFTSDSWNHDETDFTIMSLKAVLEEAGYSGDGLEKFMDGFTKGRVHKAISSDNRKTVVALVMLFRSSEDSVRFLDAEEKLLKTRKEKYGSFVEDRFLARNSTEDGVQVMNRRVVKNGPNELHSYSFIISGGRWVVELDCIGSSESDLLAMFGSSGTEGAMMGSARRLAVDLLNRANKVIPPK